MASAPPVLRKANHEAQSQPSAAATRLTERGWLTGIAPDVDEDEDFVIGENRSPQWGWYVSMTPPQDQYPHLPPSHTNYTASKS